MKPARIISCAICFIFCIQVVTAQEMDDQLSKLTEDLSGQIVTNGSKKITVPDFTDLDGNVMELGKYIADQLTVGFVMKKRQFSVLDRANLKKILAEHQLTETGLVDPANAKKLGMFSGVDALVIGKVTPLGNKISVTVQLIATDSGEVGGGGKTVFLQDDGVRQLIAAHPTIPPQPKNQANTNSNQPPQGWPYVGQDFGKLTVAVKRLVHLDDGAIEITLEFENKSENNRMAVAMYHERCYVPPCPLVSSLVAGDGTQYSCDDSDISGIGSTRFSPKPLTEIDAAGKISASLKFRSRNRHSDSVTYFTLRADFVVNQNYNESQYDNYKPDENTLPPHCKIQHIQLDIPVRTKR